MTNHDIELNSEQTPAAGRSGIDHWQTADLPKPPALRGLNILGVIGPGIVVLGLAIGSGEWLLGPTTFIKYGLSLLWVTTVAAFLQTVLNTELIRYTMYTGEPALIGFMRTRPGARFWAWVYALFYFFQVGWPGWAGASAGAIFYLFVGRLPGNVDTSAMYWIAVGTFLMCVLILVLGQRIGRTLEILNWILLVFIFGGLVMLCLRYAAPGKWLETAVGFAGFNLQENRFIFLPAGADWFLIGAFAAYSGAGGVVNLMVSSWARDKGFGMGSVVGFIPAAMGRRRGRLAHVGSTFEITPQSRKDWQGWWRIVGVDQWLIFFLGVMLGMGLPAILYTSFIEPGQDIRGLAVAAELANAMTLSGQAVLAFAVALMGAWVLFKTQLDIMEGMVRGLTDIVWTSSRRLRGWRDGDVRYVYYSILVIVVGWGLVALRFSQPIVLLQFSANMAGIVFLVSSLHILYVNTTLLPEELRPPLWRRVALVALALFYGFFVYLWLMGGIIPDPTKGFLFYLIQSIFQT